MRLICLIAFLLFTEAMADTLSKPRLTIEQFDKEVTVLKGVIEKFVYDNDPSKVHEVSLGVQSTFALDCVPIGEECKHYHKIVTKIIESTVDKKFTVEEKMQVLKMNNEFEKVIQRTRSKLIDEWKKYN